MNDDVAYGQSTLPSGIRSRFIEDVNGLTLHILEAGFDANRPLILLLHGFPELAYSWRKLLLPLADTGYHVVAPDQRGYGRTTGWDGDYDGESEAGADGGNAMPPPFEAVQPLVRALQATQPQRATRRGGGSPPSRLPARRAPAR